MVLRQAKYQPPKSPGSEYPLTLKLVCAAVYLPAMIGFVIGIIYILAKGEGCERNFFRFHFYQSVFLSICMFCIGMLAQGMSGVIIGTLRLFEGIIGTGIVEFLTGNMIVVGMILQAPLALLIPYCMIWSLMGKYATIPFVSKTISRNLM